MNILDYPLILSTRRNHALEHATIHILSALKPGRPLAGRSTPFGFYLYADVGAEDVQTAVYDALNRLERGEKRLAIHPGCGTNYLTAGVFAGLAAFAALSVGSRGRWERLPNAIMASTLALIFSAPVGLQLQSRVTTSGDMADLEIVSVRRLPGRAPMHYVKTTSS